MRSDPPDKRPHSPVCGMRPHEHGKSCSRTCPTCAGNADGRTVPKTADYKQGFRDGWLAAKEECIALIEREL